ncbi:MAG: DEAD/DEAH box helicase [Cetobacterium sp.]
MSKKYLSEMMQGIELEGNTLIVSPTGSGKTHYIINELCKNKKVLYLCDNSNLEEQVLLEDNTTSIKKNKIKRGFNRTTIDVATYKEFGIKVKYDLNNDYINQFKLIICDEIHNLVDYMMFDNDADLSHALVSLVKKYDNTQILMFTATPYYLDELVKKNPGIDDNYSRIDFSKSKEIMRYINKREAYINHMSQIQFALEEYRQSFEYDNMKCLIYANKIEDMKFVEDMCVDRKLRPICIWSTNNKSNYMSREQNRVREHLLSTGELLEPYNVLIINRATETGVNIYDDKMQLVIVNTTNITQQIQARGRVRHNVDLLVVKTKDKSKVNTVTINDELLEKWLVKVDLENMIKDFKLKDPKGGYITVNKLKEFLLNSNYIVNKSIKRLDGKRVTMYKITKIEKQCTKK